MAEISVDINGRKYRMACEDGQEEHLSGLAARFNNQIESYKGAFGEIGDNRLTVMVGLAILDDLSEAESRLALLAKEVEDLKRAGDAITLESEALEARFAKRMAEAARKVEAVAVTIDEVGHGEAKK